MLEIEELCVRVVKVKISLFFALFHLTDYRKPKETSFVISNYDADNVFKLCGLSNLAKKKLYLPN